MARVLFISYDGLLEDIGQSQILRYAERLVRSHRLTLLTFEKSADLADGQRVHALQVHLDSVGIRWLPKLYHKSPPVLSTFWDLLRAFLTAIAIVRRGEIDVVHARSTPPAAVAGLLKMVARVPYIFDMKGFWAEQRLECGAWRPGLVFRVARWVERAVLSNCDAVISETNSGLRCLHGRGELPPSPPPRLEVVPTCVDLDRFRPGEPRVSGVFTLGFVGSLGAGYQIEPLVACMRELRLIRSGAVLRVVTRSDHAALRAALLDLGLPENAFSIVSARHDEVTLEIAKMSGGAYFLRETPSLKACCPTKLAEYLACGIPCLTGPGIGDVDQLLEDEDVGVVLRGGDSASVRAAVDRFVGLAESPGIALKCRASATRHFNIGSGVRIHDTLYSVLGGLR